jgi:hypothetical protein
MNAQAAAEPTARATVSIRPVTVAATRYATVSTR